MCSSSMSPGGTGITCTIYPAHVSFLGLICARQILHNLSQSAGEEPDGLGRDMSHDVCQLWNVRTQKGNAHHSTALTHYSK